jgi:RimJ/RimL family protein N-acetyltransferase
MLSNEVCALRLPVEADADELASCVMRSLPELSRWMPWATADYDRDAALAWLRGDIEADAHNFLIIDHDGAIAGSCGLNQIDRLNNRANLGYWVRSDRAGRGLATAAARLVARHGLSELGLQRVEIVMGVENVASRRVAERAGAIFEGTMRDRLRLHERYHDAHLYSIVQPRTPTADGDHRP